MIRKHDAATANAIAKDIREELSKYAFDDDMAHGHKLMYTDAIVKLALRMAKRSYVPVDFLNRCSPDVDTMPLGELWDA